MKTKNIQAKGWFLTYPQCRLTKEELLAQLRTCIARVNIVEWVVAEEKHEDGSPHLHAFIKYEKKILFKPTIFDIGDYHGNYQVAKSWKAVETYCKKDGNYLANIDVKGAQKHQSKNKQLLDISPKEAVDLGLIDLMQLPNLIKAKAAYNLQEEAKDQEEVRGTWIWGLPGVGKSHEVRMKEPVLYIKAQNKWWDGYQAEEAVLIDDFDKGGVCLGHYLKIWADKWKCTGEIKGATIPLNFKRIYITSNYSINELFGEDQQMEAAIKRRFVEVYKEPRE